MYSESICFAYSSRILGVEQEINQEKGEEEESEELERYKKLDNFRTSVTAIYRYVGSRQAPIWNKLNLFAECGDPPTWPLNPWIIDQ